MKYHDSILVLKILDTIGIRHVKGSEAYKEALNKELRTSSFKNLFWRKVSSNRICGYGMPYIYILTNINMTTYSIGTRR